MGQIAADAAVDGGGAGIARLHQLLHDLELLGGRQTLVQLNARRRGQLDDAVLREVLDAASDVAAPLVAHGGGVRVYGHEGQLVEPAGDAPFPVDVAYGLAGAHGDAEHVVGPQAHGPGQGGHVAVVDHAVGDVPEGVGNGADVDVLDLLLKEILRHLEKERGVHGAVVDIYTGRRDADRVHPRQMLCGGLESCNDAVVVVVRVGGGLGIPDDLFGVDWLAVDDGGYLPVAAARVEADAAAFGVPADGLGLVVRLGQHVCRDDLKGMLKDVCHVVPVEFLLSAGAVDRAQIVGHGLAPADVDAEAALHPEHGLDQALNVVAIGGLQLRRAVDEGLHRGHLAAGALHGDADRLPGVGQEGRVEDVQGQECGVQLGNVADAAGDTQVIHKTPSRHDAIFFASAPRGRKTRLL